MKQEMNEFQGIVFDIQRYSIHDGPGVRTVVFLKGCPLRCPWCCNPESQQAEPQVRFIESCCIGCLECTKVCTTGALTFNNGFKYDRELCKLCGKCADTCYSDARLICGRTMSVEEVVNEVLKDRIFFDNSGGGVTLSGGEILVQWKFAANILRGCKEKGLHTAIETSGCGNRAHLNEVLKYADLILYDIKLMDMERHKEIIGTDNRIILENALMAASTEKEFILRVTLVPGCNDTDDNINKLANFAAKLPKVNEIHILPYHKLGVSKYRQLGMQYTLFDTEQPSNDALKRISGIFEEKGLRVKIGG